jgi:hypothetical protein
MKEKKLREKRAAFDPLCMSAYSESRADLKPSSLNVGEKKDKESYTSTRKILYLIM